MTDHKERNGKGGWEKKGYTPAPVPASELPPPTDAGPAPSSSTSARPAKKS